MKGPGEVDSGEQRGLLGAEVVGTAQGEGVRLALEESLQPAREGKVEESKEENSVGIFGHGWIFTFPVSLLLH